MTNDEYEAAFERRREARRETERLNAVLLPRRREHHLDEVLGRIVAIAAGVVLAAVVLGALFLFATWPLRPPVPRTPTGLHQAVSTQHAPSWG